MSNLNPNGSIEDVATDNDDFDVSKDPNQPKSSNKKTINIVLAALVLIGFLLPWMKVQFFGILLFSASGATLPSELQELNGYANNFDYNSGMRNFNILYLLYLIPVGAICRIIFELLKKYWLGFTSVVLILVVLLVFIAGMIYNAGFGAALNLFSLGLYVTLIAAIALMIRMKR